MNKELWYFFARNKENPKGYNSAFGISHEQALELLHASENDFAVIIRARENNILTAHAIYMRMYQQWLEVEDAKNGR